jgi:hypothetical protein
VRETGESLYERERDWWATHCAWASQMIASVSSANRNIACAVVIPAFNVDRYIRGAADSLLRQRTTALLEIIVVRDGSTHGTAAVVRSYGDQVRSLSESNGGPATARNLAFREVSSEIIRALPDRIEQRTKCLKGTKRLKDCPDVALCFFGDVERPWDELQGPDLVGYPADCAMQREDRRDA